MLWLGSGCKDQWIGVASFILSLLLVSSLYAAPKSQCIECHQKVTPGIVGPKTGSLHQIYCSFMKPKAL